MGTVVIVVILVLIAVYAVKSYMGKLSHGCCGGGDGPEKKVKVSDRDPSHYPYQAILEVDGMTCGNCVRRVENALNRLDGVWAKVSLEKKQAVVQVKSPQMREELADAVRKCGYGVTKVTWGDNENH